MRVELYSAWKKPGNTIGNTTRKKGKCGFYHFFVDQLKGLSTLNRSYIFFLVAGGCGFETECGVKITNPKLVLYYYSRTAKLFKLLGKLIRCNLYG